ncbi:DUF1365 domain-containing protein [Duganella sp. CT11-25]|uniref:DUF1365 domain-containing protein n=1 Tax=unclassified Duganella TaxID=2636909 RepID=UPI0039B0099A
MPPDAAPQLCFGQVRHLRLRPVRHGFRYGMYFVRLPLRALGERGFGCRLFSRNRRNLLSFHDCDHGDGRPLLQWIDSLLAAAGVHDAGGEIWLQTMPRVLGYVFNPVSFWFCHRADGALRAIVADVRNTFGERHCYLLETGAAVGVGEELAARKVFHVSPFCEVRGGYRFRFFSGRRGAGPHAGSEQTLACIDYDDELGPLLQTSLSGRAAPLTDGNAARAFCAYPLMTFGVVARIHWQALKLWLRRVPFFSKPVPPPQKVSR